MCGKTFFKYFLITTISFMASSGLYFVLLTRWLWMSPITDYTTYDWRCVPEQLGALCLVMFSIGLLIVLRARTKELHVYGAIVLLLMLVILAGLIYQLLGKHDQLNLSDYFLITVVVLFGLIVVNIFLFAYCLRREQMTLPANAFTRVEL